MNLFRNTRLHRLKSSTNAGEAILQATCSVAVLIFSLFNVIGHAQMVERLNHCNGIMSRGIELADGDQAIQVMKNGNFDSEETKAFFARKLEPLERKENTNDLDTLGKQQLVDILKNDRQFAAECFDLELYKSDRAPTLDEIGNVLMRQGQADDAVPVLQRCVAIDPDYASCWEGLGRASQSLGRTSQAKDFFSKAIGVGGFNELNAVAIRRARFSLFMIEHPGGDPMCAPGELGVTEHLAQCRDYADQPGEVTGAAEVPHRYGTGFYVSRDGHILTNNHVVAGCKGLTAGGAGPLQVVARDIGEDLALLKGEAKPPAFATFRGGPSPKIGDTVIVFGFPLPGILSSDGNVTTGVLSATSGLRDDVRFVQITAPVQPGNSGGPLLDSSGNVIGVVVAKLDVLQVANLTGDVPQNVNFAVHWAAVAAFLDEQSISYRKAPSQRAVVTRDAAAVARQMSVAVDCTE